MLALVRINVISYCVAVCAINASLRLGQREIQCYSVAYLTRYRWEMVFACTSRRLLRFSLGFDTLFSLRSSCAELRGDPYALKFINMVYFCNMFMVRRGKSIKSGFAYDKVSPWLYNFIHFAKRRRSEAYTNFCVLLGTVRSEKMLCADLGRELRDDRFIHFCKLIILFY